MTSPLLVDAEKYVIDLFESGLTPDHRYHSLNHSLFAKEAAVILGKKYHLKKKELEALALAALFHDTGFTQTFDGHEDVSIEIVKEFLGERNYDPAYLEKIVACIETTKMGVAPKTLLQKIMKDADFNDFGEETYEDKANNLRHEWEVFRNIKMTDEEWLENNWNFWNNHVFYTGEAAMMFRKAKKQNLKKLQKTVEKLAKRKNLGSTADGLVSILSGNRTAQMMFKTTLRNHIDLTAIADNKANMMLSISALIITITMPMLAGNIKGNAFLLVPIAVLLVTCLLSIIFATLATRPVQTPGTTDLSKIKEGKTNLFFYGNFYKMGLDEYKQGIREVSASDDILDNSVVMDLFFLGKALGQKFHLLRICYSVFMIGMTLTVIAFAISFVIGGQT